MADLDFANSTFEPDGPGIDNDYNFDLPDAIMDPPLRVQHDLNTSGDHIQSLRDELREAELDFENSTFDPDGPGIDDDYNFDLPDAIMDPPLRVQHDLNTSGDHIQSLRDELRERQSLRPSKSDWSILFTKK